MACAAPGVPFQVSTWDRNVCYGLIVLTLTSWRVRTQWSGRRAFNISWQQETTWGPPQGCKGGGPHCLATPQMMSPTTMAATAKTIIRMQIFFRERRLKDESRYHNKVVEWTFSHVSLFLDREVTGSLAVFRFPHRSKLGNAFFGIPLSLWPIAYLFYLIVGSTRQLLRGTLDVHICTLHIGLYSICGAMTKGWEEEEPTILNRIYFMYLSGWNAECRCSLGAPPPSRIKSMPVKCIKRLWLALQELMGVFGCFCALQLAGERPRA